MTEREQMIGVLDARVERRENRRAFFKAAVTVGGFVVAGRAAAQATPTPTPTSTSTPVVTEADVLNFALNLEYLEANFYSYAVFGTPIDTALTTGTVGQAGTAVSAGAHAVTFTDPLVAQYAREIAEDEIAHVKFLRAALGAAAVVQPQIDVGTSPTGAFSTAAQAAGFITAGQSFDPYASDLAFLYGAFIFEDVGVTAYKGASSALINNKTYLDAAAGILATEAYHASIVRTTIDQMGGMPGLKAATIRGDTELVSNARDSLDGTTDLDQGLAQTTTNFGLTSNIAPTDSNGIAFSRTTGQVLNIVYLNKAAVTLGGFFPAGVNGTINTSANNA